MTTTTLRAAVRRSVDARAAGGAVCLVTGVALLTQLVKAVAQ